MSRMHRTQIYLEPDLNEALDRLTDRRGASKASLQREAARRLVAEDEEAFDNDPIWGIIGMGRSSTADNAAVEHDRVLIEQTLDQMRKFRE
jgi:metal-responsive CopG/Arc/MetJ family transcriptional regulator